MPLAFLPPQVDLRSLIYAERDFCFRCESAAGRAVRLPLSLSWMGLTAAGIGRAAQGCPMPAACHRHHSPRSGNSLAGCGGAVNWS
ncbi:hypothetical protein HMPREF9946_02591 [Acetobacteraceae bacterium AT-5844]|nr:hypothetical protein HMPREF9946_02591 [Acetobacteraceae bacterium AT-5844]